MKHAYILTIPLLALACALAACSSQKAATTTVTTQKQSADYSDIVPGEWTIHKVDGKNVTGDERPYFTFDPANSRFYGSNGCNTINGDYCASSHSMTFSNVISTLRSCPDAQFESAINRAVDATRGYSVAKKGHEYYMTLTGHSGSAVMVLRKHNMDFINGTWKVEKLNGSDVKLDDGEEMKMVIDIPELKIHGTTGCNVFNGSLLIDPDKTYALQFKDMISTRRACHDSAQETAFLLAMEEVESAKSTGGSTVSLLNTKGVEIITLKKVNVER